MSSNSERCLCPKWWMKKLRDVCPDGLKSSRRNEVLVRIDRSQQNPVFSVLGLASRGPV